MILPDYPEQRDTDQYLTKAAKDYLFISNVIKEIEWISFHDGEYAENIKNAVGWLYKAKKIKRDDLVRLSKDFEKELEKGTEMESDKVPKEWDFCLKKTYGEIY